MKAISGKSVIASATFEGAYGIPAVTSAGRAGGLSPDGRLLVLVEPPSYNGLRSESRFLLVSTRGLSVADPIVLSGEFGFDAVSPDRRTLYLIQHVSGSDLVRYVVRAYDLRAKRLLARAIVDKRAPGEADARLRGRACDLGRRRVGVHALHPVTGRRAAVRARAERGCADGLLHRPAQLARPRTSGRRASSWRAPAGS